MNPTKQLVKTILENANAFKWSLQGLGMLRLYLSTETRLHVWDSRYAVANVSTMHDHPWSFDSLVVAGWINNYRYRVDPKGEEFLFAILQCGPGGCAKTKPLPINLRKGILESYATGQDYHQRHDEIHQSLPEDGTVTIVTRTFREDTEHARVFWPKGTEWVSAEPRPATPEEVRDITQASLARWFAEKAVATA